MSTRSAIGYPAGDGWRGRYVHYDGYPEVRGPDLWRIVKRDGVERAIEVLCHEHYGWSSIDSEEVTPDEAGVTLDSKPADRVRVSGYGVAYDDTTADDWITECDLFIEWAYILSEQGMAIEVSRPTGERLPANPPSSYREPVYKGVQVAFVRWDEPEPDWAIVQEAGQRLGDENISKQQVAADG